MSRENKKRLLFVCTEGSERSPTAVSLFEGSKKYEAKYVGISPFSSVRISSEAVKWADVIICMEDMHKRYVLENFPDSKGKRIIVLEIPDVYERGNDELIMILRARLKEFLD